MGHDHEHWVVQACVVDGETVSGSLGEDAVEMRETGKIAYTEAVAGDCSSSGGGRRRQGVKCACRSSAGNDCEERGTGADLQADGTEDCMPVDRIAEGRRPGVSKMDGQRLTRRLHGACLAVVDQLAGPSQLEKSNSSGSRVPVMLRRWLLRLDITGHQTFVVNLVVQI
jgi:hypothetical protein